MKYNLFLVTLVFLALFAMSAAALPTVQEVKINGNVFQPGDNLVVYRGEPLNIVVKLHANTTENNTQVMADILGYEYSIYQEGLSDLSPVFDMNANDTLYETLHLKVPEEVQKDYYDLRIRVGTRTGTAFEGLYRLHIKGERHNVIIQDVLFTPQTQVVSGRALIAVVRVKNIGQVTEDGIKVSVSIPELNVAASDYIDELDPDEATSSEELYLRIPECAKEGTYTANVKIVYNDGYSTDSVQKTIKVVQSQTCKKEEAPAQKPVVEKTVVSVPSEAQELCFGKGSVYPITISNQGTEAQTYTLTLEGADWATVKLSPSNVVVVQPGETKYVYAYVTPKETAQTGDHVFSLKVSDGTTEKEVTLKGTIVKETSSNLKEGLEISLIILLIILIIIGLILGLSKIRGNGKQDEDSYY